VREVGRAEKKKFAKKFSYNIGHEAHVNSSPIRYIFCTCSMHALSMYLKRILDLSRRCPFHRALSRTWKRFMHLSFCLWGSSIENLEVRTMKMKERKK
jgi:hypothetical protein